MPEAPKRFKKRDDKFGAGRRRRVCSFCSDKQGYIDYKEITVSAVTSQTAPRSSHVARRAPARSISVKSRRR